MVLSALAEGLDPISLQSVCSAFDKPPSPAFLTRAGEHAQTLHERFFCHLQLPHLRLDELRTRLRSYKQVLWKRQD